MEYITLVAQEVVNGKKVVVGKQERFPVAESLADVSNMVNEDNGWNDEEIIAAFNYGSRVKRQAQLRSESATPTPLKIFKRQSTQAQEEMLRARGLL